MESWENCFYFLRIKLFCEFYPRFHRWSTHSGSLVNPRGRRRWRRVVVVCAHSYRPKRASNVYRGGNIRRNGVCIRGHGTGVLRVDYENAYSHGVYGLSDTRNFLGILLG